MTDAQNESVTRVCAYVSAHLDDIRRLFKSGVEVTICIRSAGFPDRDLVITTEADINDVIDMLARRNQNRSIPV